MTDSLVFLIFMMLVSLVFTVKPVPKFGLLNLVLGLFDVLFGTLSYVAGSLPFSLWSSLLVSLIGVLCLWRGLRAGGLND